MSKTIKTIKILYMILIPIVVIMTLLAIKGIVYARKYNKMNEDWRPTMKSGDSCLVHSTSDYVWLNGKIDSVANDSAVITLTVPKSQIYKK